MLVVHVLNAHEYLFYSLQVFLLAGVLGFEGIHNTVNVHLYSDYVFGIKMVFLFVRKFTTIPDAEKNKSLKFS